MGGRDLSRYGGRPEGHPLSQIRELLRHLSRADVAELALASGRPAVVKVGGVWKPVSPQVLSSEMIVAMLQDAGASNASVLSDQPAQWSLPAEEVGTVGVVAMKRGEVVQARISRTGPLPAAVSSPQPPVASAATSVRAPDQGASSDNFEDLVASARKLAASDLHIIALRPPMFRIAGELIPKGGALSAERVERMVLPLVPQRLLPTLERDGSADFALQHPSAGRFRVNASRHRTGLKACLRVIPPEIPTLESLGLPESLAQATHHHQGLIVVTGPSGHGKTSTLAALVNLINSTTGNHLITVEDPIEFVHPRKRAVMSQREVGTHTKTFQSALKASLREDPDVIVVGELRDTETVRMALSASETGHLVLATMNTPGAARTIDRLIDLFPPADQGQVRMTLSVGLRMIVSQRLVPNKERSGVVAAAELLPGSVSLGNLIREEKTYQIPSLQQRGKSMGIIRLDDSLAQLVHAGKTSLQIAQEFAESPEELANAVKQLGQPAPAPVEGRATSKLGGLLGRR
jgi:twitching motility protein PilT